MTTPNPLLTLTDFAKFQTKDQQWYLDVVASTITDYCGWHIAPSLAVTNYVATVGNKGIIMLPSLHVTSVEALRLNGTVVNPSLYVMHQYGAIEFTGFLKPPRNLSVTVDFTHGFDTVPKSVAEVGFELTSTALEQASGVVSELTRGPTVMKFNEFGIALSAGQEQRLNPYRLRRV